MILPIPALWGRAGLPGQGIPAMSIDPDTGQILNPYRDAGAAPAGFDIAGDGAIVPSSTAAVERWDAGAAVSGEKQRAADSNGAQRSMLDFTNALKRTHGAPVWNDVGSYRDETSFDKWRRAGRPVSCGISGVAENIAAALQGAANAITLQNLPPGAIVRPDGTIIMPGGPGESVSVSSYPGGVEVSGGASAGVWIFALAAIGTVGWFWMRSRR